MHSASETSPDASALSPRPQAHWWHPVPETGRIVCDLCPRACNLKPGDRGFCFVRENRDGQMLLSTYGRSTGFCIDPIEKKPLNHFYPGTSVLSFGTAGCNLGCKFCQNWDISKSRDVERLSQEASCPRRSPTAAHELGCRSVAFTYNDPVVWAEYAIDTARACREQGIKTVAVTAGYITPEARGPVLRVHGRGQCRSEGIYRRLLLAPDPVALGAGARHAPLAEARNRRLVRDHEPGHSAGQRLARRIRAGCAAGCSTTWETRCRSTSRRSIPIFG